MRQLVRGARLNRGLFMRLFILSLLIVMALIGAQEKRAFAGVITDSECARGDHSGMQMGPTDAECVIACVGVHGASYVLFDGKDAYTLSDQRGPEKFAAKRVVVQGRLETKTHVIQVDSIAPAK
jgi:hypothetical protein